MSNFVSGCVFGVGCLVMGVGCWVILSNFLSSYIFGVCVGCWLILFKLLRGWVLGVGCLLGCLVFGYGCWVVGVGCLVGMLVDLVQLPQGMGV